MNGFAAPAAPVRRRLRWPWWCSSWSGLRASVAQWWYAAGGHDARVAFLDSIRAPGLIVAGMIVIFWPLTGFSLFPVGVAAAAAGLVWLFTRKILFWDVRWRVRRVALPFIGLAALVALTLDAGPLAWGIAIGVWLIIAGATDTLRARWRLTAWLRTSIGRTCRVDPGLLRVRSAEWDGTRLLWCEVDHRGQIHAEEESVRDRVATAVSWSMRHAGRYRVADWVPGTYRFTIESEPDLPTAVEEQHWPADLPGIPIGVTSMEDCDAVVQLACPDTGEIISSLPVLLLDPADERHYLIVGGTGAGKSNFTRGLIARAIRHDHFPGGVWILDGKSGSDYIVFENRVGVQCVAREPEEWLTYLQQVSQMMRARYEEDAEYHRGHRGKPDHPRYLVVLDEIQEIRQVLGAEVLDPILQQISRQMRASNGRLMVITQRPDASDAIPGAVRDMLEYRVILGYVSATGARMVLGPHEWRTVVDEYGAEPVVGRGMGKVAGRLVKIQSFRLDLPRERPELNEFYPALIGASNGGPTTTAGPAPGTRPTQTRWTPRPAPASEEEESEEPQPAEPVTDNGSGEPTGWSGPGTDRRRPTT